MRTLIAMRLAEWQKIIGVGVAVVAMFAASNSDLVGAADVGGSTASFGITTVQSTTENLNYNYKIAGEVTAPGAGTIRSVYFYVDGQAAAAGSGSVAAAVYANAAGKPGALLGSSAAQTVVAGRPAGWLGFTLSSPVAVSANSCYWLSISAGTKTVARVYRGTIAGSKVWGSNGTSVTPSTNFGTANVAAGPVSAYASYEPVAPPTGTGPVKIMALGDSITLGWNYYPGTSNPPPGGYRTLLWQRLVQQDGKNVDFVGSLSSGPNTLGDQDHEGHSGWRIDQIRANIDTYIANARPDVTLLMIGTNDVLQNYNMASAPDRLQDLVRRLCIDRPNARIVVSTIPPRPGLDSRVNTYNSALPGVVAATQSTGCSTSYFDMNSYLTASDISTSDYTHPTMAGYDKMALAWYPYVSHLYSELAR